MPTTPQPRTVYFTLTGENGRWDGCALSGDPTLTSGAAFVLAGDHDVWLAIIRQELHPLRAVVQGRLRLTGHLASMLRWAHALTIMTELAGQLDTSFPYAKDA